MYLGCGNDKCQKHPAVAKAYMHSKCTICVMETGPQKRWQYGLHLNSIIPKHCH